MTPSSRSGCKPGHTERALAMYKRHGLLALMVPALLPPPAPFKLFVLAAGVAHVRPLQFVAAIAIARGARYLALGVLAICYGDVALELMRDARPRGRPLARRPHRHCGRRVLAVATVQFQGVTPEIFGRDPAPRRGAQRRAAARRADRRDGSAWRAVRADPRRRRERGRDVRARSRRSRRATRACA